MREYCSNLLDKLLIKKKFKAESHKVLDLLESVAENPKKGKLLAEVGSIALKQIKYRGFRLYFIADAYKIKFFSVEELTELLLRFVRMSDKKHQQKNQHRYGQNQQNDRIN